MKVIKINKYDIVIYSCLLLAVFCLYMSGKDYFASLKEESTVKRELQSAIKEIKGEEEPLDEEIIKPVIEPENIKNYDKTSLLQHYFETILDRIIKDNYITYEILNSWQNYEIINFTFKKEIAPNYYFYKVNIKINNKNAILPKEKNEELSKEEYNMLTLNVYILYNQEKNEYNIKKID